MPPPETTPGLEKAGEPDRAAVIPIYNTYVLINIGGNAWWWLLLLFVPLLDLVAIVKISIDVAKATGQGLCYGLALSVIF